MHAELLSLKRLVGFKARDERRAMIPVRKLEAQLTKELLKPTDTVGAILAIWLAESPKELHGSCRPTAFSRGVLTITAKSAVAAHRLRAALAGGLSNRIQRLDTAVARIKVVVDATGAGAGWT